MGHVDDFVDAHTECEEGSQEMKVECLDGRSNESSNKNMTNILKK